MEHVLKLELSDCPWVYCNELGQEMICVAFIRALITGSDKAWFDAEQDQDVDRQGGARPSAPSSVVLKVHHPLDDLLWNDIVQPLFLIRFEGRGVFWSKSRKGPYHVMYDNLSSWIYKHILTESDTVAEVGLKVEVPKNSS